MCLWWEKREACLTEVRVQNDLRVQPRMNRDTLGKGVISGEVAFSYKADLTV